mmetsp:Transcript_7737/g.16790  ORF Transcript_7737/g.16790 Transcript_7737/m.16790 type:complete len:207 (+) Transcript_7737:226-846(+)
MAFTLASCSGVMLLISSNIFLVCSSDIFFTSSLTDFSCSDFKVAPTTAALLPVVYVTEVADDAVFFTIVFRASPMKSASKYSCTSSHTRLNPSRSTLGDPNDPSAQHSLSSAGLRSSSEFPPKATIGGSVEKALNVTPPEGGVDMNSATRNMASNTSGSLELPLELIPDDFCASTAEMSSVFKFDMAFTVESNCSGAILDICSCTC